MRNASGYQGENKWQWKKKQSEQEVHNTNISSLKRVNRKKTMARKCTKKCAASEKLFLC